MAEFDRLEQVIEFVVKLDEKSRQDLVKKIDELNEQRADSSAKTDDRIVDSQKDSTQKKIRDLEDELKGFERLGRERENMESDRFDRMLRANEEFYKDDLRLRQQFAMRGEQLSEETHAREISRIRQYEIQKHRIEEMRGSAMRGGSDDESPFSGQKKFMQGAGSVASRILPKTGHGGQIASVLTNMAGNMLSSTSLLGGIGSGIAELVVLAGISVSIGRKMASDTFDIVRGPALSGLSDPDKFQKLTDTISDLEKSQLIRESERDSVKSSMEMLLKQLPSIVSGSGEYLDEEVEYLFDRVRSAADDLGMSFTEMAATASHLTQIQQQQGVDIYQAMEQIRLFQYSLKETGNRLHVDLDIPRLVDEVVKATDALAPFHIKFETIGQVVNDFAVEVNNATLSMSDLVQWVTGATRTEAGMGAFIAQNFMRSKDPNDKELQDLVRKGTQGGDDPFAQQAMIKLIAQGDPGELKSVGINLSEKKRTEMQSKAGRVPGNQINKLIESLSQGKTKIEQIAIAEQVLQSYHAAAGLPMPKTFENMHKLFKGEGGQEEQQMALRRRGGGGATGSWEEENPAATAYLKQIDINTRQMRDNLVGLGTNLMRDFEKLGQRASRDLTPLAEKLEDADSYRKRPGATGDFDERSSRASPQSPININLNVTPDFTEDDKKAVVESMAKAAQQAAQTTMRGIKDNHHQKMLDQMRSNMDNNSHSVGASTGTSESR